MLDASAQAGKLDKARRAQHFAPRYVDRLQVRTALGNGEQTIVRNHARLEVDVHQARHIRSHVDKRSDV